MSGRWRPPRRHPPRPTVQRSRKPATMTMARPALDPELRELLADMALMSRPSPEAVSPELAEDLSALPAAYIDTGFEEVFRGEDTDYATRSWAAGGQSELHVWAGRFHGFEALHPQAHLSTTARRTRTY
ncbi:alpha/beta hydrolase [Streptomyces griseoviridis]|nr:alpha/beta hydrolase fold domain-containing protein [Streptomyces griseoviridis]